MSVLVVAEQQDDVISDVSYELITAACTLTGPVTVAVIGPEARARSLSCDGVVSIVHVQTRHATFENDIHQAAVERLIADLSPDVVLLGATVNSMGYGSAIAAKLGFGFASDVLALRVEDGALIATRPFHASKVHAEVEFPTNCPAILLLRSGAWAPTPTNGASPTVVTLLLGDVASRARHVAYRTKPEAGVDISKAEFIVAVGGGAGEADNLSMFKDLATALGATFAVSRPMVDAGWASNELLVGQSGTTVRPKVYLALGISGAIQHVAGMKASETIIAVNSDPDAAIFDVAHYGVVADIFDIAPELASLARGGHDRRRVLADGQP
jgi:electron transfer flavoprotein alpha subunit